MNTTNLDKAKPHPGSQPRNHLAETGRQLLAATARGPRYGKAASEVFRATASSIPPDGRLPNHLRGSPQDDFHSASGTSTASTSPHTATWCADFTRAAPAPGEAHGGAGTPAKRTAAKGTAARGVGQ